MTDGLLIFLGREGGFDGWLRLAGGAVAARASGEPPRSDKTERIIAVAPGERIALHWLELQAGLSQPQAAAAARLLAAELSAEPAAELHVAVGRDEGTARRCVALVPAAEMAEWLARLQAAGFDPDRIVPETLLMPAPAEGVVRYGRLYRGPAEGFALEPELAPLVLGGREPTDIDTEAFETGLAETLSPPLLDLRQGPFARRRRWRLERTWLRRVALIGLAIVAATLILQIAAILRYTFAADAAEAEAKRVAAAALPRAGSLGDPSADLGRRLSELRGGGIGYGAIAAAAFEAVQATPNVELSGLTFAQDGSLRLSVMADTPASLAALRSRIEAGGLAVESGPTRSGGGRQIADFTVVPR